MKKRRYMSLMEIMIVLLLIGLIAGAVGVNMKGSLEKGKAFKTKQAIHRLYDAIHMAREETGEPLHTLILQENLKGVIAITGMAKKSADVLKDGWNEDFIVTLSDDKLDVRIHSEKLEQYLNSKKIDPSEYYPWIQARN